MSFSFLFVEKQIMLILEDFILFVAYIYICLFMFYLFCFNPPAPEVLSQFKEPKGRRWGFKFMKDMQSL